MAIPEQHIVATSASQDAVRAVREHEFTHAASHELRTPLTVIRVASDLLAHDHGLSCSSRRSLESRSPTCSPELIGARLRKLGDQREYDCI